MRKIKDRIILGTVSGWLAGQVVKIGMGQIHTKSHDFRFRAGASLFLPDKEVKSSNVESRIISSLVNNTIVSASGVINTYILSFTGRDFAVLKGAGTGLIQWIGLYGFLSKLGVTIKSNNPTTHILSAVEHSMFGALTGLLVSRLGDDSLFPDGAARALDACSADTAAEPGHREPLQQQRRQQPQRQQRWQLQQPQRQQRRQQQWPQQPQQPQQLPGEASKHLGQQEQIARPWRSTQFGQERFSGQDGQRGKNGVLGDHDPYGQQAQATTPRAPDNPPQGDHLGRQGRTRFSGNPLSLVRPSSHIGSASPPTGSLASPGGNIPPSTAPMASPGGNVMPPSTASMASPPAEALAGRREIKPIETIKLTRKKPGDINRDN